MPTFPDPVNLPSQWHTSDYELASVGWVKKYATKHGGKQEPFTYTKGYRPAITANTAATLIRMPRGIVAKKQLLQVGVYFYGDYPNQTWQNPPPYGDLVTDLGTWSYNEPNAYAASDNAQGVHLAMYNHLNGDPASGGTGWPEAVFEGFMAAYRAGYRTIVLFPDGGPICPVTNLTDTEYTVGGKTVAKEWFYRASYGQSGPTFANAGYQYGLRTADFLTNGKVAPLGAATLQDVMAVIGECRVYAINFRITNNPLIRTLPPYNPDWPRSADEYPSSTSVGTNIYRVLTWWSQGRQTNGSLGNWHRTGEWQSSNAKAQEIGANIQPTAGKVALVVDHSGSMWDMAYDFYSRMPSMLTGLFSRSDVA